MVCYLTMGWAFLSHLHKATSFEIRRRAFHPSVIKSYLWKIIDIKSYQMEDFTIWWLPADFLIVALQQELMGFGPLYQEANVHHSKATWWVCVLGKTLKLLWGQKSIPLSSCRPWSLMLRQYHVAPSLTLVRLTPPVLWHPTIIFILAFNNQFMPSSKHECNLCLDVTNLSSASYQLSVDFTYSELLDSHTF